jgi:hypothetical protein
MQPTTSFYHVMPCVLLKLQYVAQLGVEEYFHLQHFCDGPEGWIRFDIPGKDILNSMTMTYSDLVIKSVKYYY